MRISGGSIVYGLALLLSITCVNAGIFLKAQDPVITQDATWIYSNSTEITSVAPDVPANKFLKPISLIDNLPSASQDGTIGILYNRGNSCSSGTVQQPIPVPFYTPEPKSTKVPKIALIKKQGGSCSLVDKLKNAESEGAIGAIVYGTTAISDEDPKAGIPPDSGITIPAFSVDHSVGVELYHQLEKMASAPMIIISTNDRVNLTARISVRVSLFPGDNIKPTAWELTLLVIIVILGISIIFSVAMYIYTRKKGQQLLSVVERHHDPGQQAGNLPTGKTLLAATRLYEFPTRIVDSLPDEEERKKMETVLSDEKQLEALINTTTLPVACHNSKSFFNRKRLLRKSSNASIAVKIVTPVVNSMCVVCLEVFKIGDQVRKLPCHHKYHCNCIDPWLTSKSSKCPLCKFDCSSDNKSEETIADPDGLIAAASVPGIRGMLWRPYLRFKANRRRRIGQVRDSPNSAQQPHQQSRQSTIITSTEGPPSFGSMSAIRAIEAIENAVNVKRISITEAAAAAASASRSSSEEKENDPTIAATTILARTRIVMPQDEVFADEPTRASSTFGRSSVLAMYDETQYRPSNAIQGYASTITTSASTYMPASDGGILPDIDVSSISLCSIDLSGIVDEFQTRLPTSRR